MQKKEQKLSSMLVLVVEAKSGLQSRLLLYFKLLLWQQNSNVKFITTCMKDAVSLPKKSPTLNNRKHVTGIKNVAAKKKQKDS